MHTGPRVSARFVKAIKQSDKKQYELAQAAGVRTDVLSRIIGGYEPLKPNDPRVLRLGKVLKLKRSQLFENGRK